MNSSDMQNLVKYLSAQSHAGPPLIPLATFFENLSKIEDGQSGSHL